MAISRSLMNRQLRANGGIMDVTPRENFGLGSSLKKFVRKIIPNEVAEIATKAAPFVAPFNPALAGVMGGLGTFDQTGSIGSGLKSGAMNYGGGQLARYAGGAGFQGNPFGQGGAFTGSGFQGGFSSPLGNQTGLGKLYNSAQQNTKQLGMDNSLKTIQGVGAEPQSIEGFLNKPDILPNKVSIMDQVKVIGNPGSSWSERGSSALDILKRGGKAAFTKPGLDGKPIIDKAAVMGAIAFAGSYIEALALADDAGIELTEGAYDEARKTKKQEEYAGYLTNFFGGKKDGGRIGFENGANEFMSEQMMLESNPGAAESGSPITIDTTMTALIDKYNTYQQSAPGVDEKTRMFLQNDFLKSLEDAGISQEEFMMRLSEDTEMRANGGRIGFKKGSDPVYEIYLEDLEAGTIPSDKSYNEYLDDIEEDPDYDYSYAKGGRVSRKFGSPEEGERSGVMEMLAVEVGAGGDEKENMLMADISFNSAEKSFLFKNLAKLGGADRSINMPKLYGILKNPNNPRNLDDARMLKAFIEIKMPGLKNGGRIGFKNGTGSNRVSQLLILRDEALSKGEDTSIFDAEIFQLTGKTFKSIGGISEIPTGQPRLNQGGVSERDYRKTGGTVPVGIKERADDVPAMLSLNEFVMTADSVRGIGNGSIEEGSKKLYNTMKQAEQKGKIA